MTLSALKFAVTLSLLASAGVLAQQAPSNPVDVEDADAYEPLDDYSQGASLAAPPSLALLAINKPEDFTDLPVVDANGAEIARVKDIVRWKLDESLHAVLATAEGSPKAVLLDALILDALALWAPQNTSTFSSYIATEFEPVSEYQSGHTAWGSLRDSAEPPIADETPYPAPLPGPVVDPIRAQQQELADQTAQHTSTGRSETPVFTEQNQTYETSNSPIVLLALNQSTALQATELLDDDGSVLGQITSIAKKISDQDLYAVVMRPDATEASAVKLEDLTIGRLLYEGGEAALAEQSYDADDFEMLSR